MTTANVVDVSEWQPTSIDWANLKANGVKAVVVRIGHGVTRDEHAADHIANATKAGLIVHVYHYYEGVDGELQYSVNNAKSLNIQPNVYYFLDMEGTIAGSWSSIFDSFRKQWSAYDWNTGLYCSLSNYAKFDNATLVKQGVYRWIAAWGSDQPSNADMWQYDSKTGLGSYTSALDKDVDIAGKLIKEPDSTVVEPTDPNGSYTIKPGAFVGFDHSTTELQGGEMLVASPDGQNKIPKLAPTGAFLFNNADGDNMWTLIKPKIQMPKLDWSTITNKPDVALKSDVAAVSAVASNAISTANQAKSTADSVDSKVTEIQSNGGGRNLLLKTQDLANFDSWAGRSKVAVTNGQGTFQAITGTQDSSSSYFDVVGYYNLPLEKGTDYTASFWVKTSENTDIWSYLFDSGSNGNYSDGAVVSHATTDYTRVVVHFHNGNNTATPSFVPVRIKKTGVTVWLYGCMLEKGIVAHDWSPAPEDVDANISNVNTKIDNLQIGGINLLKDTDKMTNTNYWGLRGGQVCRALYHELHANEAGISLSDYNVQCNSGAPYIDYIPQVSFEQDTDYTVSFWTTVVDLPILYLNANDSAPNTSHQHNQSQQNVSLQASGRTYKGWKQITATFKPKVATAYLTFRVSTAWVSSFKLEKGNKATDWSPAPEDIQSEVDANSTAISNVKTAAANAQSTADSALSKANSNATALNNKLSPDGQFLFNNNDGDNMWALIKSKIGTIKGDKGDAGKDGQTWQPYIADDKHWHIRLINSVDMPAIVGVITQGNANDLTMDDSYRIDGTVANVPSTSGLLTIRANSNEVWQTYIDSATADCYTRTRHNGTWTAWRLTTQWS